MSGFTLYQHVLSMCLAVLVCHVHTNLDYTVPCEIVRDEGRQGGDFPSLTWLPCLQTCVSNNCQSFPAHENPQFPERQV